MLDHLASILDEVDDGKQDLSVGQPELLDDGGRLASSASHDVVSFLHAVGFFRIRVWQPDSIESAPTAAYQPSTKLGTHFASPESGGERVACPATCLSGREGAKVESAPLLWSISDDGPSQDHFGVVAQKRGTRPVPMRSRRFCLTVKHQSCLINQTRGLVSILALLES